MVVAAAPRLPARLGVDGRCARSLPKSLFADAALSPFSPRPRSANPSLSSPLRPGAPTPRRRPRGCAGARATSGRDVPLPPAAAASPVEFKLVLVADDGSDRIVAWEGGPNRAARAGARARVAWGEPGGEMVVEEDDAAVAEPSLPATAAAALAVPPAADAVAAAGAPAAEPAPALRSFVESSDEASEEDEAVKAEAVAAVEAAAPAPRPFSRPRLADSPAAHAVLGALGGAVALGAAAAVASALAVDAVDLAVMASVAAVGAAVAGVSNKAEENKTDGEEE